MTTETPRPGNARVEAYAAAMVGIARAEGHLELVEDDLFRFARAFESSDELRLALTDSALPLERRLAVIDDLTGGRALPTSTALLALLVSANQASDLPAMVDRFIELAAAERQHEVAEVRSAIELDDSQVERLAAALSKATGKNVEVRVIIDPTVLGGLVAEVGDTVIDGTVRHRLDQMRAQL